MGRIPAICVVCIQDSTIHSHRSFSIHIDVWKSAQVLLWFFMIWLKLTLPIQLTTKRHTMTVIQQLILFGLEIPFCYQYRRQGSYSLYRWEGKWRIKTVKSPITMEITDDKLTKIVHINIFLHHCIQPVQGSECRSTNTNTNCNSWIAPQVEHKVLYTSHAASTSPLHENNACHTTFCTEAWGQASTIKKGRM